MNILDKILAVLNLSNVKCGFMPGTPDTLIGLFEYSGRPPEHSFGATDYTHAVQARCRALAASDAYALALSVVAKLNRYHDSEISVMQATPILDIGRDEASPQRQEYTINFEIRRY